MNLIVHFDEIFLKGKNQDYFVKKLADNIRRLFKGTSVKRSEGGLIIQNLFEREIKRLSLIPGIAKFAQFVECNPSLEAIKKSVLKLKLNSKADSFRISTNRSNKSFPLTSDEINRELGALIVKKYNLKVDLENFGTNIHVDVGGKKAYIYADPEDGAGGLPVGTAGKVLCLISGGIDSPVAAYQMMKRGAEIALIHFQNETRVTDDVSRKIIDLAETLSAYQNRVKLTIFPFGEIQRQIIVKVPSDYRMIISRRIMFRLAQDIAKKEKCLALATGDCLGQVASQTLENMHTIYCGTEILKLAPLLTANKSEIMKLARKIGTLGISNRPYEDCCSLFVAKHPKTRSKISDVEKIEKELDFSVLDKLEPISYHIGMNLSHLVF